MLRPGVDDMTLLAKNDEKSITTNLQDRLKAKCIYTYIGQVLVVANPFTWLDLLYSKKEAKRYQRTSRLDVPPHIFAIGEAAFRAMTDEEESQCVIISGESGAGKTEASKQIQNYLALASTGHSAEVERVKKVFLESNPLLEAFGNAKTLRNNNSSRFGKYFELLFDQAGSPKGGVVTNYLLEKSRVVKPGPGERNFHIFYQVAKASAARYACLSTCLSADGQSDDLAETRRAANDVQMSSADEKLALDIVRGVLALSQVSFRPVQVGDAEGSEANDLSPLHEAEKLLGGLSASKLAKAFASRRLETTTETYDVPLNPTQAKLARDALSKSIYSALFDFLVAKVNTALDPSAAEDADLSIGVLDIYGFEIFDKNGFEQLSINFVNEKLQQIFIALTLKAEQEEYVEEGIEWKEVKYFNNRIVCELIEAKRPPGILLVLDDCCKQMHSRAGGQIDAKFLDTVASCQSSHRHFAKTKHGFLVKHYAGDVEYTAQGFAESNRDELRPDLLELIFESRLAPLYQDQQQQEKFQTAGRKIREQCSYLVSALMMCEPHYVRCVKSNDDKKPLTVDSTRVAHQVKYLGLPQNIAVRRAGFAYRTEYHRFLERFKVLSKKTYPAEWTGSDRAGAAEIVKSASKNIPALGDSKMTQYGKSKLFIKQPETFFELEKARQAKLSQYASKIARAYRRHKSVKDLVEMSRDLTRRFSQFGKRRRASSVDRPYSGDYLQEDEARRGLDAHTKRERLLFVDPLCRQLRKKTYAARIVAVTESYLILVERATDDSKKFRRWQLRRRLKISQIQRAVVSSHADDVVVLKVSGQRDVPKANKEALIKSGAWQKNNDVKQCPVTGKQFGMTGARRHHCRASGQIYAAEACETKLPFPDAGWHTPERVRDDLVGLESSEPVEDVVLSLERRSELVAVLVSLNVPLDCADSCALEPSKSPLAANPGLVSVEFVGNASGDAALECSPPSLSFAGAATVRLDAPPGVDPAQAKERRRRADKRREARERARGEERERRMARDAQRDEQRRQENKRRLAERKARKAADREQRAKAAGAVVLPPRRNFKPQQQQKTAFDASGGYANGGGKKAASSSSRGGKAVATSTVPKAAAPPPPPKKTAGAPPPPAPKQVPIPPELAGDTEYYWQHLSTQEQRGPNTLAELKAAYQAGETNGSCLVYGAGVVDEWKKIKEAPVLAAYLAAKPPAPPTKNTKPPMPPPLKKPSLPPPVQQKPKIKPPSTTSYSSSSSASNGSSYQRPPPPAAAASGGSGGVSDELAAKLAKRRAAGA